jgi:hypothetical protein
LRATAKARRSELAIEVRQAAAATIAGEGPVSLQTERMYGINFTYRW